MKTIIIIILSLILFSCNTTVIKEKLCSNSRLLIKKGCENSKIIKIKDIEFVLVNNEIEIIDEFNIRINNQRSKLNSLI